jgi:type II secretory pathway pseudopilin PulG
MRRRRCFLLLEVVAALALLAGLGVWLLKLQADAVRQYRSAQQLAEVAARVEELLWTWRETGEPVTLPATGQFNDQLRWRREVQPARIAPGVIPTQVTLIVSRPISATTSSASSRPTTSWSGYFLLTTPRVFRR